jgi:uncharacterized membrane protein YbaN (DUF454 family)
MARRLLRSPCYLVKENPVYRDRDLPAARFIRRGLGVVCLAIGVIGLLLPVLPGIPLLIVGALLLRRPGRIDNRMDHRTTSLGRTDISHGRHAAPRLSMSEQLQLGFWIVCRSITTRLDARARRAHRATGAD